MMYRHNLYEYVDYSDWYTNKSVDWIENDVGTIYSDKYVDHSDFYKNKVVV